MAEINASAVAERAQITADAELKNEQIKGDTLIAKTRDETKGTCEAKIITVEAKNTCNKNIANKMLEIADLKAETIGIIG